MKKLLLALVLSLSVPVAPVASAQGKPAQKPAPAPTKGAGVTVTTNPTPPPNAKPAEVQDVRVLEKNPDDPYEYERLGLGAVQAGNLERGRMFFEQSWKYGELPTAAYNLACLDARAGKKDAAFAELQKAVGVGFDDETTLLNDPDLASVRSEARFGSIVAAARKNRAEGDAAVVREGTFIAPANKPVGVLVILHDGSSDPVAASNPFLGEARARGLFVAVPRGPAKAGKKRFGWGTKERALAAVASALAEAKKRAANPNLPALIVGVGRGGTLAYTVASQKSGVYVGVGSVGGAYDPGSGNMQAAAVEAAGLRGARLFFGVAQDAPQGQVAAVGRGVDALKRFGLQPALRYWPGTGASFPSKDVPRAVRETLDGVMGTAGR